MHSLTFYPDFFYPIKFETKRQSIQPRRNPPIKLGDELSLFTEGKTPKIIRTAICTQANPIYLSMKKDVLTIVQGREKLTPARIDLFALAEGFKNTTEFIDFWVLHHRLEDSEFFGSLIKWNCTPCDENNSGVMTNEEKGEGKP